MKKTERVISLLLAIILLLTGVPVGGFGMVSEARRQDAFGEAQTRLLAEGSAKALPSLTQRLLPAGAPKTGTEDSALSGSESQTIVTGSDITSTSSVSGEQNGEALPSSAKAEQAAETAGQESPAQNQEEKDAQTLEAVRREMEKNPLTGGKALPIQDVDLNGTKSLARVNYIVNRDTDGIPSSISWVLTYFAPKEKTAHQAFVVANGDNLDQPVIGNRTYAPGEEAAMKAREAARNRQTDKAPLFLYDIETKEANKDGFFLTTITTPIHRDEAMVAKINAAKAAKSIDKKALKDVAKELEGRVYTLDMISVFGEQKITKRIQVNGKADLTATDENTTPVTHVFPQKQQQDNPQQEKEKRVLFVAPNQDKKETAYQAPTFNATDTKQKEQAQILVYDFVLSQDGFYDFKAVNQRSLAQYEKQLTEIEEKGLTGEALQNARKAATLSIQPGQFAITMASEIVKAEEKTTASEASHPPTETKPSENAAPSTTEEEAEEKNTASTANATDENAERAPSRIDEKAANEAAEAAAKTAELLPLGKTLAENASLRETLEEGNITNLLQPMGEPLNPYTTKRPIIIEVVDRDNKGVKIPGAVIRIVGPNMVKEVTTGPDGQAVLEHCNAGDYKVVQVSAPKGYMVNQKKITFHFSAIETVKYVRIDDAKDYGKEIYFIEGLVVDTEGVSNYTEEEAKKAKKIANVELTLQVYKTNTTTGEQGELIEERTAYTDAQGHYIFKDLDPSNIYKVVATWAPYEYTFVGDPSEENHRISPSIRFRDKTGQPIPINDANNNRIGSKFKDGWNFFLGKNNNEKELITVYNYETGDTNVRLAGSTFKVLNDKGEFIKSIGELTTDSEGKIQFKLRPGQYIIEQLTHDAAHVIVKKQTDIQVKKAPADPTENVHWIPNPLQDITSVKYSRAATIDWGQVTPDPNFQLIIKRNGAELTDQTYVRNDPIYRFDNLRKYDDSHEQYAYQIILKDTPDYYATYEIIDGVVNVKVHPKTGSVGPGGLVTVTGNKIWYNDSQDLKNRPDSVQVILLENGQETSYRATVSEKTGWKYRFTNLPERDKQGNKITYSVKEIDAVSGQGIPGYRTDITHLGTNILNTRIKTTKIAGSFRMHKIDQQQKGLEGAQFTLSGKMENGQSLSRAEKTDAEGWLTFDRIPAGTYTVRETIAPDRFEPSTETWKVEVASDGTTIITGRGVSQSQQGQTSQLPDNIDKNNDEYVMDGPGSQPRTEENQKAKNPKEYRKVLYTNDNLSPKDKAKEKNQIGDISKRILNTLDKGRNEYQIELTVTGRGRKVFGSGDETDIVVVADHSGSIEGQNQTDVNQQVRDIFTAFSGFSNVNMGYVEYSGVTADENRRIGMTSRNAAQYHHEIGNYEANPNFPNGHDPAVRKSVGLTDPKNLIHEITNSFGGSTFTQRALMRAKEILDKGNGKYKHIILITDGGPTLSFLATKAEPEKNGWSPIYKPYPKTTGNIDSKNSGQTYQKRATEFNTQVLVGDGYYYKFTDGYDDKRLNYSSYSVGGETIIDNVFATISTVRNLTEKNGIEISTIGYNLKPTKNAGLFDGQEKYFFSQMASSPQNYSGIGSVGDHDNAATDIYNEVSKQYYLNQQRKADPTIKKAVVTDPMGKDIALDLGEDGVFNEKDYVLVASDGSIYENGNAPTTGLLSGTTLGYDENNKTLTINGLTLGADESVSLYYSVRLKENASDGEFKNTNQPTTLENLGKTYNFPIPAIRDKADVPTITVTNQPYTATGRFRIIKKNEKGDTLSGAYFTLTDKDGNTATDAAGNEIQIQPSNEEGLIEVNNLKQGEYFLHEEVAPAGYVVSSYKWKITVDKNGRTSIVRDNGQARSASSNSITTNLRTMAAGLSLAPLMGFSPVGRGNAPAPIDHQITASSVFEDGNKDNKYFKITHEVEGQSSKDRLDLYFLMVPEDRDDVNFFNKRIRDYSSHLKNAGYEGRINVIYGGYDETSNKMTSWDISSSPQLLTDVPMGDNTNGAFMDRALAYANAMLENWRHDNTVKMVTFLSKGRDFTPELTYTENLQHMAEMGVVSQYISITRRAARKNDLANYLKDSKNPMSPESKQEILGRLQSWSDGDANATVYKKLVDRVFQAEKADQVIENQRLRLPLGANIHYVPNTVTAQIIHSNGNPSQTISVQVEKNGGLITLVTDPVSLETGDKLQLDYHVTLMGNYEHAVSYPVYAAGAPEWVKADGSKKTADIQPLYISDPGQTLQIDVKGLDGYPNPVTVKLTTGRSEETAEFSLKNGESASKTILTFDAKGITQGPDRINVGGSAPTDKNYAIDPVKPVNKDAYPLIRVIYQRKALNLTVRKVFNNRLPKDTDTVQVTLVAKVGKDEIPWENLGYTGIGPTRTMTKKSDGIYETVYEGLPLEYQGKPIQYSVKDDSVGTPKGDVTVKQEQTITDYRPEDDLIRVEETEIPVLTVKNTTNELKFKKVGASGYQYDKNGNIIVDEQGKPIVSLTPLAGVVFELRREGRDGSTVVPGYEKVQSGPNGIFGFKNLPPGDYGLYETEPVLGYELPVQAVATFTIGADGKPDKESILSFRERDKGNGKYILGTKKVLKNNVQVETAITQVEATDHNQGNRKMLYTQLVYLNRTGENITNANLSVFSAAADNPILNASYTIYKVKANGVKPGELEFKKPLDTTGLEVVKKVDSPAKLSDISLEGLPSTGFFVVEIKGELAVHDDKFSTKLNLFVAANENSAHNPSHDTNPNYKRNGNISIITGYRTGDTKGEQSDILVPADVENGDTYLVKNYRGSTFFSVQKTKEKVGGKPGEVGDPLAGAKFKLWAALGRNFEIVETEHTTKVTTESEEITDQNGIVTFDNLPVNYNFYLEETRTAPGFALPGYMWLVQIRPVSYLKELHQKSVNWKDYLSSAGSEEAAKAEAASVAYNQMLYPYGLARNPEEVERDQTADKQGFKTFVYKTDGRLPLIVNPKDKDGNSLGQSVDPKNYQYDPDHDVYAEQSFGQHPTIHGMWYRKGWVKYDKAKADGTKGQMMPINEYGQPIHPEWTDPNRGWRGETLDGVSGATIRPLIVRDWIQDARDFKSDLSNYDDVLKKFNDHILPANNLFLDSAKETITNVLSITNKKSEFFINKVDQDGKPLEGATFTLYTETDNGLVESGIKPRVAKNQTIFESLKDGTYILRETKTPAGYEEPTTQWRIVVENGTVKSKTEEAWPGKSGKQSAPAGATLRSATSTSSASSSFALPLLASLPKKLDLGPAGLTSLLFTTVPQAMRGAGEYYGADNEKNDDDKKTNNQALQAEYNKPVTNDGDLQLGVWITDISTVNQDQGQGTFKAKIYVNPNTVNLANSARFLQFDFDSNRTSIRSISQVTSYSLNQNVASYKNVDFSTDVSGIKKPSLNENIKKYGPLDANNKKIELYPSPIQTRYIVLVEGTYDNASGKPVLLGVSYLGKVQKPSKYQDGRTITYPVEDSKANAENENQVESKVYHYDRYQVTFNAAGGTPQPEEKEVRYGHAIPKPQDPTKPGFRFNGWVDENNAPADFQQGIYADHQLLAQWEKAEYQVTFHQEVNDSSQTQRSRTVNSGQPIGSLLDTSFMNYQFVLKKKQDSYQLAGWKDAQGHPVNEKTPVNKDMDLYPVWSKQWTVNFFYGNDLVESKVVEDGKSFISQGYSEPGKYPNTDFTGYTWKGWCTRSYDAYGYATYTEYKFDQKVTGNINLYSIWERSNETDHRITFTMFDRRGSLQEGLNQYRIVADGDKLTDIPKSSPEKIPGYTFSGWMHYDNYKGYYTADFTKPITEDMTVYGYWVEERYTVTFINDGKKQEYKDLPYGSRISAPDDPTKEGYHFLGWMSGNMAFDPNAPVTASATYEATWQKIVPDQYIVHFDSQGGSAIADVTVAKGSVLTQPEAPTREGFKFKGWMRNGSAYNFSQTVTQDMTLKAEWEKIPVPGQGGELTIQNKKKQFEGTFTLYKFHRTGNTRSQLQLAYFTLKKHVGATKPASFDAQDYVKLNDKWGMWTSELQAFKTGQDGKIVFDHLQPGVYDLEEMIPPNGYLKDPTKYVIVVNDIGNTLVVPWDSYDKDKYPVEVNNGQDPGTDPDKPKKRTEAKSLDGEIELVDYRLSPSVEQGIVRPLQDQKLQMAYTIHLPEDVIAGDTFTIKIDDRLNFHGLTATPNSPATPITTENGEVVAEPLNKVIDENGQSIRQITYRLTNYVTNRTNIVIKQTMPLFIDPNQVRANNTKVQAENSIAGNTATSDAVIVSYSPYFGSTEIYDYYRVPINGNWQRAQDNLGGRFYDNETVDDPSTGTMADPRTGTITAYYYVFGTNCSKSSKYWLTLEAKGMNGEASDVDFSDTNRIHVKVYPTRAFRPDGSLDTDTMPPSYGPQAMNLKAQPKTVTPTKDTYGRIQVPLFEVNTPGWYQYGYIVKVTAPYAAKQDAKDVTLYTKATLYTETEFSNGAGYETSTYTNGVYYVNYLHRYIWTSEISSKDRINLTLTKRGLTGKEGETPNNAPVLAGAGFQLTNNEGFEDYVVTDEHGQLTFNNLKPGSYFLKEVLTPKGYTPVSTVWDLIIDGEGNVSVSNGDSKQIQVNDKSLTVWNSKTPITQPVLDFPNLPNQIRFTKKNEQGLPLSGAEFTLKKYDKPASDSSRKEVAVAAEDKTRITGSDGLLFWELLTPGYYEVEETKAPEGYAKPSQAVATFEVEKDTGKIVNLKIQGRDPAGENIIYNLRPMTIELGKLDQNRTAITKGEVTFSLEAAKNNRDAKGNKKTVPDELATIKLNLSDPRPYLKKIPGSMNGNYILSEKTPPAGYIKTTHQYEIEINQEERTIRLMRVMDGKNEVPYLDKGLLSETGPVILYQEGASNQISLDIVNQLLYTLPTTAGPGTFLFTLAGAFLLGLAFSLFRQTKGPSGRPRKRLPFLRRQLE